MCAMIDYGDRLSEGRKINNPQQHCIDFVTPSNSQSMSTDYKRLRLWLRVVTIAEIEHVIECP